MLLTGWSSIFKSILISEFFDSSTFVDWVSFLKILGVDISKEFIAADLYAKRNILILLLIHSFQYDNKYIAYLLYDILSNDISNINNATAIDSTNTY